MKYTSEIDINLPMDRVIELFDNPDNMPKWQPDLVSFEHLEGKPGHPGAKSKLIYQMGNRKVEMIETVLVRNLPEEFSGTYTTKGIVNRIKNKFVPLSDSKTKLVFESDFQFSGIMAFLSIFMKGAFRKQTMKFLNQFKAFAESEGS